jgi:hypothetical protein
MKENAMSQRYWVVGGEFRSLHFDRLVDGTEQVMGPFADHGEAEQAWRHVSERFRHRGAVRFAIVQEPQAA